jgi:Na+/H+-dicarboxylate symporter
LVAQIWVWILVALALGVLAGWLFWARPLKGGR